MITTIIVAAALAPGGCVLPPAVLALLPFLIILL